MLNVLSRLENTCVSSNWNGTKFNMLAIFESMNSIKGTDISVSYLAPVTNKRMVRLMVTDTSRTFLNRRTSDSDPLD